MLPDTSGAFSLISLRVYNFFGGLLFAGIDYTTNSLESRLNKRR